MKGFMNFLKNFNPITFITRQTPSISVDSTISESHDKKSKTGKRNLKVMRSNEEEE